MKTMIPALFCALLVLAATPDAHAETFELVVDDATVMHQFLSDDFGYGTDGSLGVLKRFEADAFADVTLENNREAAKSLHFLDRDNGIVFSVNSFKNNQRLNVFETQDGGASWARLGEFYGFEAPTVHWYSDTGAYAVAADRDDQTALLVFHTEDRFKTSTDVTWTSPNGGGDKIDFARRMTVVTRDVMYAGDGGSMLYTDDGAQTWTQFESLTGLGTNAVLVGTSNVIIRQYSRHTSFSTWVSQDGGMNFAEATKPEDGTSLSAVDFLDDQNGIALARVGVDQHAVLRTTDGGMTWTADTLPEGADNLSSVHYVTADVQYVSAMTGLYRVGSPTGASSNNNSDGNNGTAGTNNAAAGTNNGTGSGSNNSTDGDGSSSDGTDDDGGCATVTGNGPGTAGLLLVLLAMLLRRKRRT